ncbi:MAG TPA: PHP domain-containing protein [Ornithinibacter sp.]|nr:PHP domain-containing protein [Ornithinibacter sp.]
MDRLAIDLHTHSTASDGTETPAVVIAQAVAAGLDVVALTDHDTTLGWAEAGATARGLGIVLVPGIEVSCSRRWQSIHLLAYLPDPRHPALVGELARARSSRDTRLDRMVAKMAADGIPVTLEAVRAEVEQGATAGRPHIADALVTAGVVAHRDEAFARWLGNDSPYYVAHYAPDPVHAVGVVRAAGGVPVIAHPWSGTRGRVVSDALVEEMAAAGLAGIEVHHRDHDADAVRHLGELARSLDLLATGSSDYHGEGKLNRLGEHTTAPEVLEAIESLATGTAAVRP